MRVLLLANNRVGWHVARHLREQGDQIAGIVLHPPDRRRFGPEILEATGVPEELVIDGSRLREPQVLAQVRALGPDIGVSALFGYILRPELLELFPAGCVNIHPSLLPYNRGAMPNVWSIVDRTPAGVSLHYIDAGVDTGDVIAQREVPVEPVDTGATLYARLENVCLELFQETWPAIRAGTAGRAAQPGGGTLHRVKDVEQIDRIELDRAYTARELIDLIRARTFPPYPGAYFVAADGRRVYLRLELTYGEPEGGG